MQLTLHLGTWTKMPLAFIRFFFFERNSLIPPCDSTVRRILPDLVSMGCWGLPFTAAVVGIWSQGHLVCSPVQIVEVNPLTPEIVLRCWWQLFIGIWWCPNPRPNDEGFVFAYCTCQKQLRSWKHVIDAMFWTLPIAWQGGLSDQHFTICAA